MMTELELVSLKPMCLKLNHLFNFPFFVRNVAKIYLESVQLTHVSFFQGAIGLPGSTGPRGKPGPTVSPCESVCDFSKCALVCPSVCL